MEQTLLTLSLIISGMTFAYGVLYDRPRVSKRDKNIY
jgi:hypothetical protein